MEIRGFTVKYTKIKARRRRDEEKILQNKIYHLFSRAEKTETTGKSFVSLTLPKLV